MNYNHYKLKDLAIWLGASFSEIEALYLFGSRRYRTLSPRSDIDVLVQVGTQRYIRPADLRAFSAANCPALDLFVVHGGRATSCENDSHVDAANLDELVAKLDAVCFWKKSEGVVESADVDWVIKIPTEINFVTSVLLTGTPVVWRWPLSFRSFAQQIEAAGLPTCPYLGATAADVSAFLIDQLRRAIGALPDLNSKGKGITAKLNDEYDFQNLFYLTTKPWLPTLSREDVTIRYDGQEKRADFNLFGSQLVWEFKHVKDANTKAQVVKTLSGLSNFYSTHPNIRVLTMAILVEKQLKLDDSKWEADYSFSEREPKVWTRIFRNL